MYFDIDKAYAINVLRRVYERYGDTALIRETEHGYHIKIPLECTEENFIYCLVVRREFDDRNRIAMDIIRLGVYDFSLAFALKFSRSGYHFFIKHHVKCQAKVVNPYAYNVHSYTVTVIEFVSDYQAIYEILLSTL